MRKVVAAINMTIDGFCDHTAVNPGEDIHDHYADLLRHAGLILYGRVTYQLMQFWQPIVKNPTGQKAMDEFAVVMDKIPKIVFSHTLKDPAWDTAALADRNLKEEILALKQEGGRDILLGSPSIIVQATDLNLIDEYQLCIHPVILGSGLPLFNKISGRVNLKLMRTKIFDSGPIIHYYEPTRL